MSSLPDIETIAQGASALSQAAAAQAAPELLEAKKASDILLMECSNAVHSTAMLHFDKVYAGN